MIRLLSLKRGNMAERERTKEPGEEERTLCKLCRRLTKCTKLWSRNAPRVLNSATPFARSVPWRWRGMRGREEVRGGQMAARDETRNMQSFGVRICMSIRLISGRPDVPVWRPSATQLAGHEPTSVYESMYPAQRVSVTPNPPTRPNTGTASEMMSRIALILTMPP